jgi:NADPH-dependent ferric siderophore reductase
MAESPASIAPSGAAPAGGPRRRRGPPKLVTVTAVQRVTPRLTRLTFQGEELAEFGPPRPGAHVKLLFVPPGSAWSPKDEEAPRPPSRTYTPRRYDRERRTLEVEFVHHGDGLAATWAARAKVGDPMYVAGPGGGYDVPETPGDIVLVADDTAMPAAGTILEALPPGCRVTTICEVWDKAEERPLSPSVAAAPVWLHYGANGAPAGSLLERAVMELAPPPDPRWWIACEAGAMRRIRRFLLQVRGVDPSRLHTRGYWRIGDANYPDHDYGTD